jgi:hypothetical protein
MRALPVKKAKASEIAQLVHEHLTAGYMISAFEPSEDQSEQQEYKYIPKSLRSDL